MVGFVPPQIARQAFSVQVLVALSSQSLDTALPHTQVLPHDVGDHIVGDFGKAVLKLIEQLNVEVVYRHCGHFCHAIWAMPSDLNTII
jgi:hypothetical protein